MTSVPNDGDVDVKRAVVVTEEVLMYRLGVLVLYVAEKGVQIVIKPALTRFGQGAVIQVVSDDAVVHRSHTRRPTTLVVCSGCVTSCGLSMRDILPLGGKIENSFSNS